MLMVCLMAAAVAHQLCGQKYQKRWFVLDAACIKYFEAEDVRPHVSLSPVLFFFFFQATLRSLRFPTCCPMRVRLRWCQEKKHSGTVLLADVQSVVPVPSSAYFDVRV
jgi:hypothetical protein